MNMAVDREVCNWCHGQYSARLVLTDYRQCLDGLHSIPDGLTFRLCPSDDGWWSQV